MSGQRKPFPGSGPRPRSVDDRALADGFAEIESKVAGRLGVAAQDIASGRFWAYRPDERFPMCSTFKAVLVGALLARVDAGQENLDQTVRILPKQLVVNSPAARDAAETGRQMSISELCRVALTLSDNTATNKLLERVEGPAGLTGFMRGLGDYDTRLDRWEAKLNQALPGDPRDTTTPVAMLNLFNQLVLGDVLSPRSRRMLRDWMVANTTGDRRIRASLPPDWVTADKTGTGENGATGDVAVIWPTRGGPFLMAIYLADCTVSLGARERTIAAAARLLHARLVDA